MAGEVQYQYEPLLPGEIRILVLHPGQGDDELSGRLEAIRLNNNRNTYKAISYAWGDPTFRETLQLPGGTLRITASLAGALRRFRDSVDDVRLWADAICIDQANNPAEKSLQVGRMGDIHRQAGEVLVWLGDSTHEMDDFYFWTLYALAAWFASDRDVYSITTMEMVRLVDSTPFPSKPSSLSCPCCKKPVIARTTSWDDALFHMVRFWNKAWFNRLWVLQEVMLAQHVTMHCGSHSVPMTLITRVRYLLYLYFLERANRTEYHDACFDRLEAVSVHERGPSSEDEKPPLLRMLIDTRGLLVTDPRDRIWAVRSICREPERPLPEPDYTISPSKLWIDLSAFFMTTYEPSREAWELRGGVALPLVLASTQRKPAPNAWPSWAVDFGRFPLESNHLWAKFSQHEYVGSSKAAGYATELPIRLSDHELAFKGIVHALIATISPESAWPGMKYFDDPAGWFQRLVVPWIENCRKYISGESVSSNQEDMKKVMKLLCPYAFSSTIEYQWRLWQDFFDRHFSNDGAADDSVYVHFAHQFNHTRPSFERTFVFHERNEGVLLAQTSGCRFCWVPGDAAVDDKVCLLAGGKMPFVLRSCEGGRYRVIGDAWVDGIMDGEAWPADTSELQDIILV